VSAEPGDGAPPPDAGAALGRRHRAELEQDRRVERRLTWRELGCLLFVAVFILIRARYLV
jgi:hypothetical protein